MSQQRPQPYNGPVFWTYFAFAVVLLIFSLVAGFGIGFVILPIPVAMFVSMAVWSWPWVVTGLASAGAAFTITYLGTAPSTCFERSFPRPRTGCTRWWLPDVAGLDVADERALALALAVGAAALVGIVVALVTRAVVRGFGLDA